MSDMNTWDQLVYYFNHNGSYIMAQFLRHFLISAYGVFLAALLGVPLGIIIARKAHLRQFVMGIANVLQTIPSLAMISILMLGLGLGTKTVIATVFLYSLLPIISNTYTGIKNVSNDLVDVAKGMGMTKSQRLFMVELPLSLSVIMAGIRNALVVAIGITAIGAFVGGGGLGDIIVRGTNATNGGAIILAGSLPTALMAIFSDIILGALQRMLEPKGNSHS
ncbi:ABC transporter permease [Streptococcus pseudoporcinus]|uniref:Glycine betaine/carnitine/choline transport system permease protein opuCD n=1 Tax=Streptococcus pseudoporcinus LQ 940-04 TaxID=875093 RepID=G5KA67_9STRE|nr:ABC transporter permease [Streptococcus pseudoporcinus]EFR43640.1 ABC transporter, permease protein [Streptococcus pseudoporcinus SPIN 20026]EHI64491.1 glycine betaine/carnitine/choline transport system permease protein opuCD [Streptococcus pseudoporcinus LQ 940-04]VEF93591.1 Osmotically activated L-carnitine/choline ABC transporter, permease protein OpuCD [Streptococcus pseudoporcinus]